MLRSLAIAQSTRYRAGGAALALALPAPPLASKHALLPPLLLPGGGREWAALAQTQVELKQWDGGGRGQVQVGLQPCDSLKAAIRRNVLSLLL